MYSFRKSKKGFTLIELMVVVAIIGVLALMGLRLYSGQQDKAKNSVVKANVGSIQTQLQSELADTPFASIDETTVINAAHIFNPWGTGTSTNATTGQQTANPANWAGTSIGEVWVDTSGTEFLVHGMSASGGEVYPNPLVAR